MNEWKKVSEELPTLDTPVWAGWFNVGGDKLSKPKAQGYFRRPESTPRKTRLPVLHRAGI